MATLQWRKARRHRHVATNSATAVTFDGRIEAKYTRSNASCSSPSNSGSGKGHALHNAEGLTGSAGGQGAQLRRARHRGITWS